MIIVVYLYLFNVILLIYCFLFYFIIIVSMILRIAKDIKFFLFVVGAVLAGFAQAFWLLGNMDVHNNLLGRVDQAFLYLFVYMLGQDVSFDFDGKFLLLSTLEIRYYYICIFNYRVEYLFSLYCIVVTIIQFNQCLIFFSLYVFFFFVYSVFNFLIGILILILKCFYLLIF